VKIQPYTICGSCKVSKWFRGTETTHTKLGCSPYIEQQVLDFLSEARVRIVTFASQTMNIVQILHLMSSRISVPRWWWHNEQRILQRGCILIYVDHWHWMHFLQWEKVWALGLPGIINDRLSTERSLGLATECSARFTWINKPDWNILAHDSIAGNLRSRIANKARHKGTLTRFTAWMAVNHAE
jgi:hypothetical protein